MILEPGIHHGITDKVYHSDPCVAPSLSRSIAWEIVSKSAAHAWIKHPRLNPNFKPEDANEAMDFGSVGHELLLGKSSSVEVKDFKDFRTDAAKDWKKECLAAGKIPVLPKTRDRADLMYAAALQHLKASGFLAEFLKADSEVTVIAGEKEHTKRARFDKLLIDPAGAKNRARGEHAIAFDLKITSDASPKACTKQVGNMGYYLQSKFYKETLQAIRPDLAGRIKWVFLFIESEAPFAVTPIELDGAFEALASSQYNRAISAWARGITENHWPTYCDGEGSFTVSPPPYLLTQEMENDSE